MQVHISPSMRTITICTSNGLLDLMKIKVAARHFSYRTLFHTMLILAVLLPFVFILTAVVTLEGVNKCSSLDCLGRRWGPKFLGRSDDSLRLVGDLHKLFNEVNHEGVPDGLKVPSSFGEFVDEIKNNRYDAKMVAVKIKAMVEYLEKEVKLAKLQESVYKHYAATAIPKTMQCLSLRLTDEYSSNAHARKQLPSPELLPSLSNNNYHHFVLATDNILAASVVVSSTVKASTKPENIVFHLITDKKTYAAMHSWFALNPLSPAIIEVKGTHQFDWLTRENIPVLEAIESHQGIRKYYHGSHTAETILSDNPRLLSSKLQARSPKYILMLNHLRIYLPERDLAPLWDIDLKGKVCGAVETCRGEDSWVMSKRFKNYFNFSHPLIAENLDPEECAWAYGMNMFDLRAWRMTNIRDTYLYWIKENLKANLALWRFGTLPPALIAFSGHVHPIDPSWHMLGLGYQHATSLDAVRRAAVIHYNGDFKPWLGIGFKELRPFWTKHVNFSNDFIRNCNIVEP
ncbi:probable galacturonosyltransferase 14 isoform X2 [Nymphaea colorata]|uniref:probable galacturonosyltransferase 14 isoform X2 n=1 Tax=Nymphaea colorata TaxID=210225 RepID=UPI00129EE75D|nr:probable galacturonosyltransferase 14 isoform X2 [Nymphaea colorata]